MGIKGAHKFIHSLVRLSISDLKVIGSHRCKKEVERGTIRPKQPTIDVDASWIYRSSKLSLPARLCYGIKLCLVFVERGFAVVLICDGVVRHHSKRASTDRRAKRYRTLIDIFLARARLMILARKRSGTDSLTEIQSIEEEERKLSDAVKRKEKNTQFGNVDVGQAFYDDLKDEIASLDSSCMGDCGGTIQVLQACFQADSVMAARCVNGISDLVLANDSDLAALAGVNCLSIKIFRFSETSKKSDVHDVELFSGYFSTISEAARWIGCDDTSKRIKRASLAIFDGIIDARVRSLIAVGIGCDVYVSGVEGITPKTIELLMEDVNKIPCPEAKMNHMLNVYVDVHLKKRKIKKDGVIEHQTREMFSTFADAFMLEPASISSDNNVPPVLNDSIWIHGEKPRSLHKYLEAFASQSDDITIISAGDACLSTCKGPGCGQHIFMTAEGHSKCSACSTTCCPLCTFGGKPDKYCVDCYISELSIPSDKIRSLVPTEEMVRRLRVERGTEIKSSDSVADIIDLYDALFSARGADIVYTNDIMEAISMPFETSVYLRDQQNVLLTFDMRNGAQFLRQPSLIIHDKINLFNLLAQLVDVRSDLDNCDKKMKEVHSVVPILLVQFAKHSRVNTGYRLLRRAVRHAMDPRTPSILLSSGKVVKYTNDIGFYIKHQVRASMKSDVYDVEVCFTTKGIVSCSCTCKAGSEGTERVVCVHILPVIFQFSLLMFDGLADHCLYEFATEWHPSMDKDNAISDDVKEKLLKSIQLIQQSAGEITKLKTRVISDALHAYTVGTENRKLEPPPPKDPSKLGPLRKLDLTSPIQKSSKVIQKNMNNKASKKETQKMSVNQEPNYRRILDAIEAIQKLVSSQDTITFTETVGHKLLQFRASKQCDANILEASSIRKKMRQALISANSTHRKQSRVGSKKVNDTQDHDSTSEEEESERKQDHSPVRPPLIVPKKNRYACCVLGCTTTSATAPSATYTRVPRDPCDKITSLSSDNERLTFYKKDFLRQEWLRRLGLARDDLRQQLRICSNHELECAKLCFQWKNTKGEEESTECWFQRIPECDDDSPKKTRQQLLKRKPAPPLTTAKHRKVFISDGNAATMKARHGRYCNYVGCKSRSLRDNESIKFYRVPPPVHKKKEYKRNDARMRYSVKKYFRAECLRRIGSPPGDTRKDVRICSLHETAVLRQNVPWEDNKGNPRSQRVTFCLPTASGVRSNLHENATGSIREPRGLGGDRLASNYLQTALSLSQETDRSDIGWALELQMAIEHAEGDVDSIHPLVRNTVGLSSTTPTIERKSREYGSEYKGKHKFKTKYTSEKTVVSVTALSDDNVKDETGYRSLHALLAMVAIICDGDVDMMRITTTTLTWFEEWYFFFERQWGRTTRRWKDCVNKYERGERTLRDLFSNKLSMFLCTRQTWPTYVTIAEDEVLRKDKWNTSYAGKRVVMWDNTKLDLPAPSCAEAQRNTYSAYYAGNVAKGAVFVQLCGWMGTYELWMGAVSDSDYMTRSGILEVQKNYITLHDKNSEEISWINILDKGYRIVSAAWRTGEQFVLQPAFAKSDRKFTTIETIRSSTVASDRGGNERAVRIAKICGFLKDGLHQNQSSDRLSDVWLAWSFQANFIYKPVL